MPSPRTGFPGSIDRTGKNTRNSAGRRYSSGKCTHAAGRKNICWRTRGRWFRTRCYRSRFCSVPAPRSARRSRRPAAHRGSSAHRRAPGRRIPPCPASNRQTPFPSIPARPARSRGSPHTPASAHCPKPVCPRPPAKAPPEGNIPAGCAKTIPFVSRKSSRGKKLFSFIHWALAKPVAIFAEAEKLKKWLPSACAGSSLPHPSVSKRLF